MIALTEVSLQQDRQHGIGRVKDTVPVYDDPDYKPAKKLQGKVALIIGGDSGIGRAVAISYAKEGALLAIVYLDSDQDAQETKRCAERYDSEIFLLKGNIGNADFARSCVISTIEHFGQLDILVNTPDERYPHDKIVALTHEALKYMSQEAAIINTSTVSTSHNRANLNDYSDAKDAVSTFTRWLSNSSVLRGIRVNAVAPGSIWTSSIIAASNKEEISAFGKNTPMKRPGQPYELAPAYVYLACNDSSYMSGQTLYINGGEFVTS